MSHSKRKKKSKHRVAVLLLTVVFVIISFNAIIVGLQTAYPKSYPQLVESNAVEYGLDSNLLYALIEVESGFNKKIDYHKEHKRYHDTLELVLV